MILHELGLAGVAHEDYFGSRRSKIVVGARIATVVLCRRFTVASYPEIAAVMNRPNHSSVITMHRCWQTLPACAVESVNWAGAFIDVIEPRLRGRVGTARIAGRPLPPNKAVTP